MGGMFMCTIHKQQFLYNSVIKLFQQTEMGDYRKFKKNECSGKAAKFQSRDHQTVAPIHASSLRGEVFLATPL